MGCVLLAVCETEFFTFLVGQSCRSALNSWAARQRRRTDGVKNSVSRPYWPLSLAAFRAGCGKASLRLVNPS
jgi:hypothetical protein